MNAGPQNITPGGGDNEYLPALLEGSHPGTTPARAFNEAMMKVLFSCNLPKKKEEFDEYHTLLPIIMAALPRIPNINECVYRELVRDYEDIHDMEGSDGAERILQNMVIKHIYALRLSVARGDIPLPGLTAVSSIISSRTTNEHRVSLPAQAPAGGGGIFGFLRRK